MSTDSATLHRNRHGVFRGPRFKTGPRNPCLDWECRSRSTNTFHDHTSRRVPRHSEYETGNTPDFLVFPIRGAGVVGRGWRGKKRKNKTYVLSSSFFWSDLLPTLSPRLPSHPFDRVLLTHFCCWGLYRFYGKEVELPLGIRPSLSTRLTLHGQKSL